MKKNIIALLLSIVLATCSVGAVPVYAAETTTEKAIAVEEETMDENGEVTEEAETADGDIVSEEVSKDEPAHVEKKYYEEDVNTTGDNETMKSQDESVDTATTSEVSYADEEAVECYAEIYDNSITEISNIEEPVVIEEAIVEDNENQAVGSTVASGMCGANLTWVLDSKGKLTISGTGEMNDYNNSSYTPWSNYRTQITEVILEKGVTSIGNNAFRREASFFGNEDNEDTIKNVTIPDTVTKIGNNAFQRCASITEIKIPDSVTKIGGCAFLYCDSLTEVTLPERLTCIEWSLFESCTRLTRVTIPASVTSIERRAFSGCSSLTNVTIPEGVTSIEDYTFWSCRSLKEVTIPNSVTSIGLAAFYRCTQLTNLIIPDSIMSIVESAFLDCSNLIVYTPGEYVISYCKSNRIKCCPYIKELSPEPGTENFDISSSDPVFYADFWHNIKYNDGFAYLFEVDNDAKPIEEIFLGEPDEGKCSIENGNRLVLNFSRDSLKKGKSYYIRIEENALKLLGDGDTELDVSYPGLADNVWEFSTPTTGLYLTIFSNKNDADAGHAFLNIENLTDEDLYIGTFKLAEGENAYIGARSIGDAKGDHYIKDSKNGIAFNFEGVIDHQADQSGDNVYRDFAWFTVSIQKDDLEELYKCIKDYGKYNVFTNNCAHFASKAWNSVVDEKYKVKETGIPGELRAYIINTFKGNTASVLSFNDKTISDIMIMGSDGELIPYSLETSEYLAAVNSLKIDSSTDTAVTLKWNSPLVEIGKGQNNITKTVLDVYIGDKLTYTYEVPAGQTKYIAATPVAGIYSFKIYGVSDHKSKNIGIVTGSSSTCKCELSVLPGASSKVTCTNVASGIKVSWEKVQGATSYYIYRDNKQIFKTSALNVTDKEVKYNSGTKYVYKVVATTKNVGDSPKARTATMYRLMPVGIKSLTNPSAGKMTVTYDKANGSSGYVVRYGLKSDMSDAKVITVSGANTTSRTFGSMQKGKTYYVQVRTYKIENGVRYYSGYCTTKTITIKK